MMQRVLERLQTIKRRQIEIHEIYEKELLESTNSGVGCNRGHSRANR